MTDIQKDTAIALGKRGLSYAEIARELGLSRQLVRWWLMQVHVDPAKVRTKQVKKHIKLLREEQEK